VPTDHTAREKISQQRRNGKGRKKTPPFFYRELKFPQKLQVFGDRTVADMALRLGGPDEPAQKEKSEPGSKMRQIGQSQDQSSARL